MERTACEPSTRWMTKAATAKQTKKAAPRMRTGRRISPPLCRPELGEAPQRLPVATNALLPAGQLEALVDAGRHGLARERDALGLKEVARVLAHDVELVLQ